MALFGPPLGFSVNGTFLGFPAFGRRNYRGRLGKKSDDKDGDMSVAHKISTTIGKDGNLILKNWPFAEGTRIDILISKHDAKTGIQRLIENDHVWSAEDIEAVHRRREIINQWNLS